MNNILQNTPEWEDAKQSKIGASEIYSLVHHYCKDDLQKMGFDLVKERPFRTIQELFLKVKFGAKLSKIDSALSQFGNGIEPYIIYRLKQEMPQLKIERSKEFIVNENLHPLAACSPDGYVELTPECQKLPDFDKTCVFDEFSGKGMLELKTANYFANFDESGSRLSYIFQLQYQMMVLGLKWGILAVLTPKEKEFDEPFFKGKILGRYEADIITEEGLKEEIDQYYDLKSDYIYPQLPAFQAMIIKALNAFQNDLDTYETDQSVFPRNSEDLTGLQREKQLWAQLWPEKYGKLSIDRDSELNQLFNERYKWQEAVMFSEQDKLKIENQINELVKREGLGKYTELKGSDHRMTWIKNGQVRFYKNN